MDPTRSRSVRKRKNPRIRADPSSPHTSLCPVSRPDWATDPDSQRRRGNESSEARPNRGPQMASEPRAGGPEGVGCGFTAATGLCLGPAIGAVESWLSFFLSCTDKSRMGCFFLGGALSSGLGPRFGVSPQCPVTLDDGIGQRSWPWQELVRLVFVFDKQ